MWQYREVMSPVWRMSTYQPHPPVVGLPSTSHGIGPPVGSHELPPMLHGTRATTPPDAARITVPRGAMMSTPSCPGRSGVRNPEPTVPATGRVHPDALIGALSHTGRAPPVYAATMAVARASCRWYASGYADRCTA